MERDIDRVLGFWLDEVGAAGWFAGGAALDDRCREGFAALWQQALDGGCEGWLTGPRGALAYLVLTDQLPRNIFRGQAQAFATDPQARAAARRALAAGWDLATPEPERMFFYLPFEHAEDEADQTLSVALMAGRLADAEMALHARAHQAIIARFGRFPFRNAALGRETTAAEAAFLNEGGYAAAVKAMRAAHGPMSTG
jgi:uncharacterized protein (DUF924 family)